ncbi:MAG: ATP-dependent helicase [Symploca sp. SIO2B6]|nr:ATP-dependent helicase [Symploca sp. SIO2B6]
MLTQDSALVPSIPLNGSLQTLRATLRPGQKRMADWQGGPLAVSAVPGAGKSTGMAIAAAIVLAKRFDQQQQQQPSNLDGRNVIPQELIIVTFTRSAASNLKAKIRDCLRDLSLPPLGFSVYTLHGLALHIAQRHPEQSGINLSQMTLMTPTQGHRLIRSAVERWIVANPKSYERLIQGQFFDGEETERLRRQSVLRTEVLPNLATTAIHEAKSSGLSPEALHELSQGIITSSSSTFTAAPTAAASTSTDPSKTFFAETLTQDLLAIATGLYAQYQQVQQQRNTIDYDDMMLAALRVLDYDHLRYWWQSHVFAVFEDEAQDSSPLQTRLLEILAQEPEGARDAEQAGGVEGSRGTGESGRPEQVRAERELQSQIPSGVKQNYASEALSPKPKIQRSPTIHLVRVGDPNQAINSTFTPADPVFFRQFCLNCAKQGRLANMAQAGRSSQVIMQAANFLVTWVNEHYPFEPVPFRAQQIHPVTDTDPQPDANPAPIGSGLEVHRPPTVVHTVALIAQKVAELVQADPEVRLAILVREHKQGRFIADCLRSPQTYNIPVNVEDMGIDIYDVGERDRHSAIPAEMLALLRFLDRPHSSNHIKTALKVLVNRQLIPTQDLNALATVPEAFLYPGPLEHPASPTVDITRRYCTKLLKARLELPPPQLIPFLAFTLKYDQTELATADKLCDRLRQETAFDPSLSALLSALADLTTSEQFGPVETEQTELQYTRAGQITIMTMHKAKGLDWDGVFLPFLHARTIPGQSWVPPQMQFLGNLNINDVAKAQIRQLVQSSMMPSVFQPHESLLSHDPPRSHASSQNFPDLTLDIPTLWERAKQLKTAEELRLLYVAMTRAKRLLWMAAAHEAPFTWNKPEVLSQSSASPALIALMRTLSAS